MVFYAFSESVFYDKQDLKVKLEFLNYVQGSGTKPGFLEVLRGYCVNWLLSIFLKFLSQIVVLIV